MKEYAIGLLVFAGGMLVILYGIPIVVAVLGY